MMEAVESFFEFVRRYPALEAAQRVGVAFSVSVRPTPVRQITPHFDVCWLSVKMRM